MIVRVTQEFGPRDANEKPIDCVAPDDLNTAIGADDDPNVIAALSYLNTGACPVAAASGGQFKAEYAIDVDQRGPPHREYLDVY